MKPLSHVFKKQQQQITEAINPEKILTFTLNNERIERAIGWSNIDEVMGEKNVYENSMTEISRKGISFE